eukprot:scpid42934/ scgid35326/ 
MLLRTCLKLRAVLACTSYCCIVFDLYDYQLLGSGYGIVPVMLVNVGISPHDRRPVMYGVSGNEAHVLWICCYQAATFADCVSATSHATSVQSSYRLRVCAFILS